MHKKGTYLVQGSIGFTTSDDQNGFKRTEFQISPKLGYQFNDHFTVGVQLGLNGLKSVELIPDLSTGSFLKADNKVSTYAVGGFLRYSQLLAGAFSAYADFSVGITSGKQTQTFPANTFENKFNGLDRKSVV